MIENSQLASAFASASGVDAGQLSLVIRTILLVSIYTWAVWIIYGAIKSYKHHEMEDIPSEFSKFAQVLFVVTLATILVVTA